MSLGYMRYQSQDKAEGYPKDKHAKILPTMDKHFH